MRTRQKSVAALLLAATTLSIVSAGPPVAVANPPAAPDVVRVDTGAVRGVVTADHRLFQGIPFAAPPVGALRWQPPRPAAAWSGVRDTTQPASPCPQAPLAVLPGASNRTGSTNEDCLYLNVWTPARAGRDLPVFVWLHGGSNIFGAGSDYDGSLLARQGLVVVTVNYRLGALGFLAHPGLSAQSPDRASGDYGLMDQQAAMRWVQRNARAFGGDPRQVTVGGESAGATDTCAHLASPTARGLFVRALQESGTCVGGGSVVVPNLATAQAAGLTFASAVGCADAATAAACLRSVAVPALIQAEGTTGWGPSSGPTILPISPAAAWATGRVNAVPALSGSNHDEYRFFTSVFVDFQGGGPLNPTTYAARIGQEYPGIAGQVLAQYPAANYASPNIAYATLKTDQLFSCRARADDILYSSRRPVFGYEFNDPQTPPFITDPNLPQAAFHAGELAFLFPSFPLSPRQQALSAVMVGYWAHFIAAGNPNARGLPAWPRYQADRIQQLAPDDVRPISTFAADHNCAFWQLVNGVPD